MKGVSITVSARQVQPGRFKGHISLRKSDGRLIATSKTKFMLCGLDEIYSRKITSLIQVVLVRQLDRQLQSAVVEANP